MYWRGLISERGCDNVRAAASESRSKGGQDQVMNEWLDIIEYRDFHDVPRVFLVDVDGSVKEVKIIRGIHPLMDKEAIRVIKLTSKKWKPGRMNGEPVKVRMVIPVKFA